jgi:hypothetical protein
MASRNAIANVTEVHSGMTNFPFREMESLAVGYRELG